MGAIHEQLLRRAKKAINDVFDDRSVGATDVELALKELMGEVEECLEAMKEDGVIDDE